MEGLSAKILDAAAQGIRAVTDNGRSLDEMLNRCPREYRSSVGHLLFMYFRHRRFLDSELAAWMKRPPEPYLHAVLRAAATQMYFQNAIAPEAAANIAVGSMKNAKVAGFVNAVLRRITDHRKTPPETPETVLPDPLLTVWSRRFSPEELREQTAVILAEPRFTVRALRDFPPPEAAEPLPGWGGFRFFSAAPASVLRTPTFQRGEWYIQDPATSLAPSLPDYTQVNSALDVCAAPGGKTLMIAERLRPTSRLVAADRSAMRQESTRANCSRCGVAAEIVTAEPHELEGSFDLVLADVPCGNSGVFRHRPDAMWRYSPERQRELVALQRSILDEAARLTAPGGQLVYSTCSIEPEENELNIEIFIGKHPDFQLLKSRLLLPSPVNDGAFAALLIREK